MTPRLKWVVPMIAALVIAGWLLRADRNALPFGIDTSHVSASSNAPAPEAVRGAAHANAGPVAVEPPHNNKANVKSPSAAMQAAFAAATDWRAFAMSALQRPGEGGRYYANYAADLCGRNGPQLKEIIDARTAQGIATSSTVSAQRLAAVEKFFSRCAAFATGETKEVRSKAFGATDGADPLVEARNKLFAAHKSKDAAQFRQSALDALRTADPLLLSHEELLLRLMVFDPASQRAIGKDYWFDGETYPQQDDTLRTSELLLAVKLGTCREGALCALDDEIDISCVTGTDASCQTDRSSYLKNLYIENGGNEQSFDNAMRLAAKIRNAIETANVNAFVRPN